MTRIHAIAVRPDTVLSIDGQLYFVEAARSIDELKETVTHALRAIDDRGCLSRSAIFRCFDFEDMLTLKG